MIKILDLCCGPRMMWFDKDDGRAVFCDQRIETLVVTDRSHGNQRGTRSITIRPSVAADFRDLPFAEASFQLAVFDPPHILRAGPRSWLAAKYGRLASS